MMLALFIVGLVVTVVVLWSKIHEARYQLLQVRSERDTYASVLAAVRALQRDRTPVE